MHEPEPVQAHRQPLLSPALRYALAVFITVRVVLAVFAALLVLFYPSPRDHDPQEAPSPRFAAFNEGLGELLLDPWQRFDAHYYVRIAAEGYGHDNFGDTVFAPLYPALIRSLGLVLGGQYSLAAMLISNIAALAALILLFQLVEFELDRSTARRATLYLAVSPVSFFLFIGYSESLYLALSIAAVYLVRQGRWGRAGMMALLASWTRTSGWLLAIPFLLEYIQPRKGHRPPRIALLSVAAAPLGLASFLLFRYLAGFPSISMVYSTYWRSRVVLPWQSILVAIQHMMSGMVHPADLFDFCSTFVFIGLALAGWRRIPHMYSLHLAAGILFPLTQLKVPFHPLQSQSRYLLILFPAFMILAQLGERPWVNRVILYLSVALLLFWTGQFVIGGWVA